VAVLVEIWVPDGVSGAPVKQQPQSLAPTCAIDRLGDVSVSA